MLPTLQLEEESLPILTVAEGCSEEFPDTSRFVWLVSMARAIYSEPPQLLLRPDETWDRKEQAQRRRIISGGVNFNNIDSYLYKTPSERQASRKHEEIFKRMQQPKTEPEVIEYDKHLSKLKELTELRSTKEPPWVNQPGAFKEKIHRDDFRTWCLASGYKLPRFWFPPEEGTDQLTPAQRNEAQGKRDREQAEAYAKQQRDAGAPFHEIIVHLEENYGYTGQALHDIIWPEETEKRPNYKRKKLTLLRQKK